MPKDSYDREVENRSGLSTEQQLRRATDRQLLTELERRGYSGKVVKNKPSKDNQYV